MADVKAIFSTLNNGSDVGVDLRSIQSGDSTAAKNGTLGFAFKDTSGNAILPSLNASGQMEVDTEVYLDSASNPVKPQLDSEGRIRVSMDAAGVHKKNHGEVSAGSLSLVDVATISLSASKTVLDIKFSVSSRKAALFQLIQLDDVTETILDEVVLDAGQFSMFNAMDYEIQTGATGTQSLKIKAKNFEKESSLRASIRCKESVTA